MFLILHYKKVIRANVEMMEVMEEMVGMEMMDKTLIQLQLLR
jgi:hypothetical protein